MTRLLAVLLIAGAVSTAGAQARTADADTALLSRMGEARTIGPDTAKVLLLEFLDYQCSICAAFHSERGDSLRRAVGPDVRIVYVNLPLSMHLRSLQGAEAAMCAAGVGGQRGYAAMADRLLRRQGEWENAANPTAVFTRYAREAGLDTAAFADCRDRDVPSALVLSDLSTANTFGISGTPSFVVISTAAKSADEGLRAVGNVPISQLTALITQTRSKAQ